MGEEGELKALASHYLCAELGGAYDLRDFRDAWENGAEVEKATKAKKAALTGLEHDRIKTTVRQVTLRTEVRIMHNNARAFLVTKIWTTYRDVIDLPRRPKGEQITKGRKRSTIDDPEWDFHAQQMRRESIALGRTCSRRRAFPALCSKFVWPCESALLVILADSSFRHVDIDP